MSGKIKKVVLAYSGGLDTSVILRWLQETYQCEVVTFTADIGQGEELEPAREKALLMGVKEIFIEDLREEFVRDFVFPRFRGPSPRNSSLAAPWRRKRRPIGPNMSRSSSSAATPSPSTARRCRRRSSWRGSTSSAASTASAASTWSRTASWA